MTAEEIAEIFPNLKNYQITSPKDYRYNCIAWAAGDTKNWWQPSDSPYFFWLATIKAIRWKTALKLSIFSATKKKPIRHLSLNLKKSPYTQTQTGCLHTPPDKKKTDFGQAN